MATLLNKITRLEEDLYNFFGTVTFEEIHMTFGVDLFGLDEDETEIELDKVRDEWNDMSLKEKYQIVEQILERR